MSPDEIAKHASRAIEAMRMLSGVSRERGNAFVAAALIDPKIMAVAVEAYLRAPVSDEEYYSAHDCPTCDPIDHCPHGNGLHGDASE